MKLSFSTIVFDKKFWLLALIVFILFFRFWDLDLKPTHFDEGINGHFVEKVKARGYYDYNPENYHGPLYFYLLAAVDTIFGSNIAVHRALAVSLSLLSLLVLYLYRHIWQISWIGFLFLGFSPALTFFARYSIHESLLMSSLVFYLTSLLMLLNKKKSSIVSSFFIGSLVVMATTKETFVIHIFSSIPFLIFYYRKDLSSLKRLFSFWPYLVSAIVFIFLYSNAFQSPLAVLEFLQAYMPWLSTGVDGNGHEKAIYYYLSLMVHHEAPYLIGFLSAFYFLIKGDEKAKLISSYALLTFLIYSLIPYKTPWLFMSIIWPFAILSDWTLKEIRFKEIFWPLISLIAVYFLFQSYQLNFKRYADDDHLYVYVQSSDDMKVVARTLKEYAKKKPEIKVYNALYSQWPLPWLLKDLAVSYGEDLSNKEKWQDFMLVDLKDYKEVEESLEAYYSYVFRLRGSQDRSVFLVHKQRGASFLKSWKSKEAKIQSMDGKK